ncbi:MAG: ATP-dependent protease subunit HslV [Clostridiales bacterium]|nr:ATP-dependent protease subunit HslV [Clostridiales bacterium]MDD6539949.1 ATP-dependent protease subunit HslV [Bacillota bacterium]MDD7016055.1 ATP-dependent protease subunit HslV [Bacillota bacterium]MDY4959002.1 ATP-dependent protease subunit HslV [Lentihominibacter sp.]
MVEFHATTICAVKRGDDVCIGGDGQVTMGETAIMKNGAKKVKKIYKNTVVSGFAGSVADAFSLTEKFESKLDEHGGNLKKASVALAQLWRSDKAARNLEALMIVADKKDLLVISGNGEVIEPDQPFVAIGSGGNYAYAAANALYNNTDLDAESIVRKSLEIAASICVYTNNNISIEKL